MAFAGPTLSRNGTPGPVSRDPCNFRIGVCRVSYGNEATGIVKVAFVESYRGQQDAHVTVTDQRER